MINRINGANDVDRLKPLPQEIAALSEEDTACQFCGVSYLLLHKYEAIQQHVQEMEIELEDLKQFKGERPSLISKLESVSKALALANAEKEKALLECHSKDLHLEEIENTCKQTLEALKLDFFNKESEIKQKQQQKEQELRVRWHKETANVHSDYQHSIAAVLEAHAAISNDFKHMKMSTKNSLDYWIQSFKSVLKLRMHEIASNSQSQIELLNMKIKALALDLEATKAERQSVQETCRKYESDLALQNTNVTELKIICDNKTLTIENQVRNLKTATDEIDNLKTALHTALQNSSELKDGLATSGRNSMVALAQKDEQILGANKIVAELRQKLFNAEKYLEDTVSAHQSRIKQLQDKFSQELQEARGVIIKKNEYDLQLERQKFLTLQEQSDASILKLKNELDLLKSELTQYKLKQADDAGKLQLLENERIADRASTRVEIEKATKMFSNEKQALSRKIIDLETLVSNLQSQNQQSIAAATEQLLTEEKQKLLHKMHEYERNILQLKETVKTQCEERIGLVTLLDQYKQRKNSAPPLATNFIKNK